ncbi:MAG: hypothetical protein DME38_04975 [Verrucomicrobia bacterium]|nr:MAG: hypothetical protein DME38_04975 [Verrucomicrobiota bacterium]
MSIEGLGRKFQEARNARNLSLEEAARLTRIRQSRLAEIEADDFSTGAQGTAHSGRTPN